MNRRLNRAAALIVLILAVFPNGPEAQTGESYEDAQVVDRVAAVVGNEIILLSEVQRQVNVEMMNRNMDENTSTQVLQRLLSEVLDEMVNESLLLVKAAQDSIVLDPTTISELEKEQFAALRNQYQSDEELAQALADYGITEPQIRYMIREMMVKSQLQEQILQGVMLGITVTPQDLEAWVVAHRDSIGEMEAQYRLSHILRYFQVSESRKEQIIERIQGIRERIINGEDFAEMARQYSEDPGTREDGGDLGYFSRGMLDPEFGQAAFSLDAGEVSDVVETQLGYHLIKVEDIRGEQIRARHILFLLQPTEEDNKETIALLNRIRDDIIAGRSTFEEMAAQYSEDENSSTLGGRLQWLTADAALPSFIQQAEKMQVGDISMPFESQFGYHLLRLDNFRPAHRINVKDDSQIIRQMVMNEKSMAELDRILERLRAETYIQISLE